MCLEIHLRIKHDKLLLQALPVRTQEVVFSEVDLERIIVDVILLLPTAAVSAIADVATFVLVPAMGVELVIAIETLTTEAALRVSLETALIDGTRIVVAKFLVLP
jgi:hypothetical protein